MQNDQMKIQATRHNTNRKMKLTAANKRLVKKRVQCLNEFLRFVSSVVQVDSFVLRNPLLRQAPNVTSKRKIHHMKEIIITLLLLIKLCVGFAQKAGDTYILNGYFIVSCYDTTIKSGCDLNIRKTTSIAGDSMSCGDGNFYRNISVIKYVDPKNFDLKQIDEFSYQVKLQKDEHNVYLSTDPIILSEADNGDSVIIKNADLINSIKQNQITADEIQKQIEKLNLDFKKKRHYYVLMEVSVKVLILPKRKKPTTFTDPCGLDQYLILCDKNNIIKAVKVIKDPF